MAAEGHYANFGSFLLRYGLNTAIIFALIMQTVHCINCDIFTAEVNKQTKVKTVTD